MRRDLGLVRKMLLAIEDRPEDLPALSCPEIDGYGAVQIDYHAYLLVDAGFCVGDVDLDDLGGPTANLVGLTWAGHAFAELVRHPKYWDMALEVMAGRYPEAMDHPHVALLVRFIREGAGRGRATTIGEGA